MQAPPMICAVQVKTQLQGWRKMSKKIFQDINEPFRAFRKPKTMQAPILTCAFYLNRELEGWQKMLDKICYGLRYSIDGSLVDLQGEVDPKIFIKRLYKARSYVVLQRFDYRSESRKSRHHFMRCTFEQKALDVSWYKKIIGALKTLQDVSLTIDTPPQMGNEMGYHQNVYLSGNFGFVMFMKMLEKTGTDAPEMQYGFENDNPKLMPPSPMKLGTETQPAKDTLPPPPRPPEVPSASMYHHPALFGKPHVIRRLGF